jgi:hypothetical protein
MPVPSSAASPIETASCLSVLRPCPREYTRTRAASLAGTSSTDSPSAASRWARDRPAPRQPSTARRRRAQRAANAGQLLITVGAAGEPGRVDQGLGHRAGPAAVLLALCGSTAIITSSFKGFLLAIGGLQARRAMQLTAAQTSLEPQPHRVSRTDHEPFVSQNTAKATAADSQANPPRSTPEDPRSPNSRTRSKQVAESARAWWLSPCGRGSHRKPIIGLAPMDVGELGLLMVTTNVGRAKGLARSRAPGFAGDVADHIGCGPPGRRPAIVWGHFRGARSRPRPVLRELRAGMPAVSRRSH